jgi:hypothetical protein
MSDSRSGAPRGGWKRSGVVAAAIVVLVPGVLLARSILWPGWTSRCETRSFSETVWMDSTRRQLPEAVRGCVVDDLLRLHDLRGMPRTNVIALLGEPDATPYFREYDMVYWLGPERGGIQIDSEWLLIRLDSGGRVRERTLATD